MNRRPNTPLAEKRLERALCYIQRAQTELDLASAELSTLRRGVKIWGETRRLTAKVKAIWYRVAALRGNSGMTVDSEPEGVP